MYENKNKNGETIFFNIIANDWNSISRSEGNKWSLSGRINTVGWTSTYIEWRRCCIHKQDEVLFYRYLFAKAEVKSRGYFLAQVGRENKNRYAKND